MIRTIVKAGLLMLGIAGFAACSHDSTLLSSAVSSDAAVSLSDAFANSNLSGDAQSLNDYACIFSLTPSLSKSIGAGPVDITGTIGVMHPPSFTPFFVGADQFGMTKLENPALVHIPLSGTNYVAIYNPSDGFKFEGLPEGKSIVMTEDKDAKNGILRTMFSAYVAKDGIQDNWQIISTLRKDLEDIYKDVPIDPTKAQIVLSITKVSPTGLGPPIQGIRILAPQAQAQFVDTAGGAFTSDASRGTGPLGMAILANVSAESYPGQNGRLRCIINHTLEIFDFPISSGAVSRVYGTTSYREQ